MNTTTPVICEIIRPASVDEALHIIKTVHASHQPVIFLSTPWLSCWLNSLPSLPKIVLFKRDETPVGYALLGTSKPLSVLPFRVAYLNQSGQQQQDQIWVEFNDLICDETTLSLCIETLLTTVFRQMACIRLVVSMCSHPEIWSEVCKKNNIEIDQDSVNAYKTILPETWDEETLFSGFSSNTRQQLRRSIRSISEVLGEITINSASISERTEYLDALSALHIKKWGGTKEGSGFENPIFVRHHQQFIATNPKSISLLKLSAGNTVLGYGYYLLDGDSALFYCAGINQSIEDNKAKPGYLLHLYAMRYFCERGIKVYDFMAGEFRYKRSLSNHAYSMSTLTMYNPNPIAKAVETLWRWLKNKS
ncbi:hypothetical protein D210916BOD24_08090 [Alteromonas sp. D210916BOD_24]|uniref:GNAT family N-acetyltransferase n=1 Tax=Alteromonas sp. D210916BOD_24 TaxID=3157618 RepID=UPI00399D309C